MNSVIFSSNLCFECKKVLKEINKSHISDSTVSCAILTSARNVLLNKRRNIAKIAKSKFSFCQILQLQFFNFIQKIGDGEPDYEFIRPLKLTMRINVFQK